MTLTLTPALRDWIPATRELTIDAQLVPGEGSPIDVFNPATEQVIATVTAASTAQVDAAVRAARAAFGPWSQLAPEERSRAIHRLCDVLELTFGTTLGNLGYDKVEFPHPVFHACRRLQRGAVAVAAHAADHAVAGRPHA